MGVTLFVSGGCHSKSAHAGGLEQQVFVLLHFRSETKVLRKLVPSGSSEGICSMPLPLVSGGRQNPRCS